MTIWNIHLMNARHGLTRVLPEIRATAREAVARVSDHADLPPFDLVVKAQSHGVPDWGVTGGAPSPGLIELALAPERFDPALMLRVLVRAMHRVIRLDAPATGRGLGEALVGEGLAGHFVLTVLGGKPDPWDATTPASGLARRAMNEWARLDYDHSQWFLGKGELRKWAGYGLGHRLVAEHLSAQLEQDAAVLAVLRADEFRAALRRLVGADGTTESAETAASETPAPPDAADESPPA